MTHLEDTAIPSQEGHVDRKTHAEHMNPLRGDDVCSFAGTDVVSPEKPPAAGFARSRPLDTRGEDNVFGNVYRFKNLGLRPGSGASALTLGLGGSAVVSQDSFALEA